MPSLILLRVELKHNLEKSYEDDHFRVKCSANHSTVYIDSSAHGYVFIEGARRIHRRFVVKIRP